MKILRIGIVCFPSVGGSGIVATRLGMELAERGHEVHFVSYDIPVELKHSHFPTVSFHKVDLADYALFPYPDYTLPLAVTLAEVQRSHSLDILHVHYAVPHATAALLAKNIMEYNGIARPSLITTLHGTDISLLARNKNLFSAVRYSILRSDAVTAVSRSLRDETERLITGKEIEVIYNFYRPSPITQSGNELRQRLKIDERDFVAIHLSNLRPVKRIPDLIEVAKRAKAINARFKLLILAGDDFSPYELLANELGSSLIVLNGVNNVGDYIRIASIGLYTSQTESFGMGILETMSYGKTILATRSGGVPEVVDDGTTGFLLEVGDVGGFVDRVCLLMADPQLTVRMGNAASKAAAERFASPKIVQKYIQLYQKLAG